MRVGCRFTRVALRELNSEYRRRTSRSYDWVNVKPIEFHQDILLPQFEWYRQYSFPHSCGLSQHLK